MSITVWAAPVSRLQSRHVLRFLRGVAATPYARLDRARRQNHSALRPAGSQSGPGSWQAGPVHPWIWKGVKSDGVMA